MAHRADSEATPSARLEALAREALDVAKKAGKHKQNLGGSGFYANKFADLKIAATNAFTELQSGTAGDTSALAEMIGDLFKTSSKIKARREVARELMFALKTTWKDGSAHKPAIVGDTVFPSSLLEQTRRGYLIAIGRQINGCFQAEFYDACAVMMRRAFEISIIEAFEAKSVQAKIKNANGDYLQLSDLIAKALSEPTLNLSRNCKKALPNLRDGGHQSAHGRSFIAQKMDIERMQPHFRVALEELLRVAGLL